MSLSVLEATPEQHPVVRQLLQLYLHDFSEFDSDDVDAQGLYHYPWIEDYWHAPHAAYVFKVADHFAGFCLVDTRVLLPESDHSMAEFFVLRKYRRSGLGRAAASSVFSARPGRWEVAQQAANLPAQDYWRKVIAAYTNGNFTERRLDTQDWQGPVQTFRVTQPLP